jgi:hypothetical protein
VVALTPTASLAAAFGLAGGGYLTGREDVAACGALAGAFGLVVERFATRGVRLRLRRERMRHRSDLADVSRLLHELQRDLAGLRTDLDDVRSERDVVRSQLHETRSALVTAQTFAVTAAASAPAAIAEPVVAVEPVAAEPVVAVEPAVVAVAPSFEAPRVPISMLLPGQMRSPIATGGIPVLEPGPSEPVRVVDLRAVASRSGADDETQPIPAMSAQRVDALVYAAMAEAEAAELSHTLHLPDGVTGRHAGALHTGDAHHAGDYSRELQTVGGGTATLYIVRTGKHVA